MAFGGRLLLIFTMGISKIHKTDAGLSQQLSQNHPILASFLSRKKKCNIHCRVYRLSRGVPYND